MTFKHTILVVSLVICSFAPPQDGWKIFECKNDCKVNLIFKLKYPSDWICEDPDHYGIIKKFRPNDAKGLFFLISATELNEMSEKEKKEFISAEYQRNFLKINLSKVATSYKIKSIKNVFIEANFAVIKDYISESNKITGVETRISRDYNFIYNNYLINMNATIILGGNINSCEMKLNEHMKQYSDIFDKIANSLVLKRE